MKTSEDLESYLVELGLPYEEVETDLWLVKDESEQVSVLVSLSGPVILIRITICERPADESKELYRLLLELNATELLYGAYGIEGEHVVLVEVLSAEHTSFAMFRETLEALFMTVATQRGMIERAVGRSSQVSTQEG